MLVHLLYEGENQSKKTNKKITTRYHTSIQARKQIKKKKKKPAESIRRGDLWVFKCLDSLTGVGLLCQSHSAQQRKLQIAVTAVTPDPMKAYNIFTSVGPKPPQQVRGWNLGEPWGNQSDTEKALRALAGALIPPGELNTTRRVLGSRILKPLHRKTHLLPPNQPDQPLNALQNNRRA